MALTVSVRRANPEAKTSCQGPGQAEIPWEASAPALKYRPAVEGVWDGQSLRVSLRMLGALGDPRGTPRGDSGPFTI